MSFDNPKPDDYYIQLLFSKESFLYQLLLPVETFLRSTILVGEISSDPGGLEARWIIKAAIPLGCILLLLRSISLLIEKAQIVMRIRKESIDGS